MILSLYPNGVLLAASLGISTTEPVIHNPNGQLFMVCFCASFVLTLLISGFVTYHAISWWLVKVANYSREEVRLALTWRAYPQGWSITNPGPSSDSGQVK
jgi:hypothetical protein